DGRRHGVTIHARVRSRFHPDGDGIPDVCRARGERAIARSSRTIHSVARRGRLAAAPSTRRRPPGPRAGGIRRVGRRMILLYHPHAARRGTQPLPLSLMWLPAVREREGIPWSLVDGNVETDPAAAIVEQLSGTPRRSPGGPRSGVVSLLAVTVMPGPQLTQAV